MGEEYELTLLVDGKEVGPCMEIKGNLSKGETHQSMSSMTIPLSFDEDAANVINETIRDIKQNGVQCVQIPIYHISHVINTTRNKGALKTIRRLVSPEIYDAIIKETEKRRKANETRNQRD